MKGRLLVCLLASVLPGVVSAQTWEDYDYENLQFRGLGLDFGAVLPAEIEPALSLGVRGDLGFVGPHVRVSPSIRFWSSALREEEVRGLANQIVEICERQAVAACPSSLDLGQVRRSDLELSADAHYLFASPLVLSPYAGGGLSLHLLNGRGEFIDDTFVEDLLDTVAPGVSLLAGLELPLLSSLRLLGEARLALTSDVQYANFVFGGAWTLPSPPPASAPARRPGGVR